MEELNLGMDNLGQIENSDIPQENLDQRVEQILQSLEKSKQIRKKIKGIKKGNNLLAIFLQILLQILPEDQISLIYQTFFLKIDEKGYKVKNSKPNILLIVGLYAPFFEQEIQKLGLNKFFEQINYQNAKNFVTYIEYTKNLLKITGDDNINKKNFSKLILEILLHHNFIKLQDSQEYDKHHQNIHKKIYE